MSCVQLSYVAHVNDDDCLTPIQVCIQYLHRFYNGASILLGIPHSAHFLGLNTCCRNLDSCAPEPPADNPAKQHAAGSYRASFLPTAPIRPEEKVVCYI